MSASPSARPLTLLGFDFGEQRTGVATGQTLTGGVTPLTTLKSRKGKPDWEAISALIEEWQPDLLIVGLPLNMDGTDTMMTAAAIRFGNQLKGRYNLPVEMVDERLTSIEARRQLYEEQPTRRRVEREQIDQLAAQFIVEGWLQQQGEQD